MSGLVIQAQENPFKKYGVKGEILTLSKGKYKETFYNEEVMRVGTVLINTLTDKVVVFLEPDTTGHVYRAEVTSRFISVDPLCEEYYSWSPYVYCLNNPLKYIDPDGRDVKPVGEEALEMIRNTLTTEDMKYIQLDKNGLIDKQLMNSHKSKSGNFGALLELVNSDILTEVSFAVDQFSYMDNDGKMQTMEMSYFGPDPEFMDPTGSTMNDTTTGESGRMGVTLLPGKGTSTVNSPDNTIKVIMNKNLSPAARAEMYSHEANGHALMYVRTGDRKQSGHQVGKGWVETNIPLRDMIIKSKQETVTNMKSR